MISVYTSLFNYSPEKFDVADAFSNWSKYANEIIIATFEDQQGSLLEELYPFASKLERCCVKIVSEKDTSLDDPLFDGKLKNCSLRNCFNNTVIQQDFDERIGGKLDNWIRASMDMHSFNMPVACLIPVIDLYKDLDHYKSTGSKWYLTPRDGVYRGPVNFAKRENGSIDTEKSDTCEAIDRNGDLLCQIGKLEFLTDFDIELPHVIHLGYLDLEKRAENNKFWEPVWSARNGSEVKVETSIEQLEEKYKAIPHNLKRGWWND